MIATPRDDLTIERFEAADVDPAGFDHEAHVYVAWLYVMAYPRREAIARFDAALRRLVAKVGASNKYNATITWLYLLLIAERIRVNEDWASFRARNADLIDGLPRSQVA
ncbi:MAG: hypothetical protein HKO69_04455 [Woeseiaceae bacterium]|nr:hypothetical protein [Gammaproteobacteria bacterium]NNF48975.1 hypothetical protein [Woeseiaceae bacterium]NNK24942.1 hypothetical protein [Woeseiaceae bacterium]NNL63047.1 hypothetical protein [Woeseiaceae bacterium]